jgi:hypothetical protein
MSQAEFRVDAVGVGLIAALTLFVGPATIVASAWVLTAGLDFAAATRFELIVTVMVCLLALLMIRVGVRELRGAFGIRIDASGVESRGLSIPWSEVDALDSPTFGVLDVIAKDKRVRVQTYLYREPKRLIDTIAERTGKSITMR